MPDRSNMTPQQLEDVRARDRAIKAAIPLEDKRAYNAQWRESVSDEWRERKRAYNRERYQQQKDRLNEQSRRRWYEHHEESIAKGRAYYAANRAARIKAQRKHIDTRRARLLSVPSYRVTETDWTRLVRRFDGCCAYCGVRPDRLYREHVVPLSRGGGHSVGNLLPSCLTCNLSKGSKTLTEWRALHRRLGRLGTFHN